MQPPVNSVAWSCSNSEVGEKLTTPTVVGNGGCINLMVHYELKPKITPSVTIYSNFQVHANSIRVKTLYYNYKKTLTISSFALLYELSDESWSSYSSMLSTMVEHLWNKSYFILNSMQPVILHTCSTINILEDIEFCTCNFTSLINSNMPKQKVDWSMER